MGTGDFLRKGAVTPSIEHFNMAGVTAAIATNSPALLEAARDAFCPPPEGNPGPQMYWRLWSDPQGTTRTPWPKPYYRGLDHLIFAGLDSQSSILIDLQRRLAIGRLSPALAADQAYWTSVLFPNLLTLVGPAIGVTGLHCACVVRDGGGILLAGRSRSGKSTLTLAMTRAGFNFLSDDWTYFSRRNGQLYAWGLIPRIKLLPAAAEYFPELSERQTTVSANGETAYELHPEIHLGLPRSRFCPPRDIIFLERTTTTEFDLSPMPPDAAMRLLEDEFLTEGSEGLQPQLDLRAALVQLRCWRLRYGEPPLAVARRLAGFFGNVRPGRGGEAR